MSYFLSQQKLETEKQYVLAGEEARHILLSRRIKKGEQFNLQGMDGNRFLVELVEAKKDSLTVKILQQVAVPKEPNISVVLFQSVVNEKALDFIFQKGTELGVFKIVLFNSQNVATKLSPDLFKKKAGRWTKILWEAAKQSGRAKIPSLDFLLGVEEVIKDAAGFDKVFLTDISGDKLIPNTYNLKTLGLIIGPEGGLTPKEIDQFKNLDNHQLVNLGPFTLRSETAAVAALAIIINI